LEATLYFLKYAQRESCGECTFCRIGTVRMMEALERIRSGLGKAEDVDTLGDLATKVNETCLCEIGKIASGPVLATLRYFKEEYDEHIVDHSCRAGKCDFDSKLRKKR
jgi:NADH-quinone oxidoreductase subunit F